MNNRYHLILRGYCFVTGDYMVVEYDVEATGAIAAVKLGFDISRDFNLEDRTLLSMELIAEDIT